MRHALVFGGIPVIFNVTMAVKKTIISSSMKIKI